MKNRCFAFSERAANLHAVLLLQFQILLPEGIDTIDHGLDELNLRVSKTMLVGNVVGVSSLATRFTTGTTGLETHAVAPGLQSINGVLGPAGEVNVDGGAHASAQVGGARVNIAEFGGDLEVLARFTLDITALLHGNDTELILLVDPDKESFVLVVENTTAFGPVTLHTCDLQVGITRHEEEMVVDELLTDALFHTGQRVVVTSQISIQLGESILHESLNIDTLLLGDSGGKTESLDGAADTDSAGVNWDIGFNVGCDFGGIHV